MSVTAEKYFQNLKMNETGAIGPVSNNYYNTTTPAPTRDIDYKYDEGKIIADFKEYIDSTYNQHYNTEDNIQAFDAWIALGDSSTSFRDTAIKYLWRYGKKNGLNKKDILKVMHYCIMLLYVDHYKGEK